MKNIGWIVLGILAAFVIVIVMCVPPSSPLLRTKTGDGDITRPDKCDSFVKTAIVTGGARGIGASYAMALLKRGYKIIIIDILNAVEKAAELKKQYGDWAVEGIACDVTNRTLYRRAFEAASAMAASGDGVLDVVIFNAGVIDQFFHNSVKIIETNLLAPIYGTELYIKQVTNGLTSAAKKECNIIITGSLASFVAIDINLAPVYDASKAGVGEFVRATAPIARRNNIRINAICPTTMVDTELTRPFVDTYLKKKANDLVLSTEGRGGVMHPDDMIPALYKILDTPSLNGELVAVNKSLGINAQIEPEDEYGAFSEYGVWNETKSNMLPALIDYRMANINPQKTWSE